MKIINGYFWEFIDEYDALVVTTNGVVKKSGELVMGAGIARDFAERWTDLPKRLGTKVINNNGNNTVWVEQYQDKTVIAYPTKFTWKQPSSIALIKHNLPRLIRAAEHFKLKKILVPPLGCGLGGLNWADVKSVIEKVLDDRFVVCLQE